MKPYASSTAAAMLLCGLSAPASAAFIPNPGVQIVTATTGARSFVIESPQPANSDHRQLGIDTVQKSGLAFNPANGPLGGVWAYLLWTGEPFKVRYEVEGVGYLQFSDTVTVTARAFLDGTQIGSDDVHTVTVSGSCGDANAVGIFNDCRATAFLTAFSDPQSITLPHGVSYSSVDFAYIVTQSDESCTSTQGTQVGACLAGGVSILDTTDAFDPTWSGTLQLTYQIPEPASFGIAAMAIAGLAAVRRRRF